MNKNTQDAIAYGFLAVVLFPVSGLAAFYALSFSWLAWGLFGFVLAGIALAIAMASPWCVYGAYRRKHGKEVQA